MKRLALLACILLSSQLYAEKITATAILSRNPIGLGEKVYLTIELTYDDVTKVQVEKPVWPEGLVELSGPTIRNYYDANDPDNPRKVHVYYTLRGDRIGRIAVDPISITAGGVDLRTDPFILGVGYWRNREIYIPYICRWHVDPATAFVGQAVTATLVLHDMDRIPAIGQVTAPRIDGAFIDPVPEVGSLERMAVGSEVLFQLPIAAFLLTPSRTGTLNLPSVGVRVAGTYVESAKSSIQVVPIPADILETGAIGSFEYSVDVPIEEVSAGDEFLVTVRVEGSGNLNYLNVPEPAFDGFVTADIAETSDYSPTLDGYAGFRELHYRVVAQTPGRSQISAPEFSWMELDGSVRHAPGTSTAVRVNAESEIVVPVTFPFTIESAGEIFSHRTVGAYRNANTYLLLLPGILAVVILSVLKKLRIILVALVAVLLGSGRMEIYTPIDRGIAEYDNGNYARAAELFRGSLSSFPGNPGLLYNSSVAAYRSGDMVTAMHEIRLAIKAAPTHGRYRLFAEWMNHELEHPAVVYPSLRLDPDVFFYLFFACVLIGVLFFLLQLFKSRGIYVIAAILALSVAVTSLSTVGYIHFKNRRASGIIGVEGAPLRTIPSDTARERFVLAPGVSVRAIDSVETFFLVETGAGTSGWIPVESLVLD